MKRISSLLAIGVLALNLSGCAIGGALFKGIFLRSGAPPRNETRRMEEREEVMLRELPDRTILVLPVGVLNVDATYDVDAAERLAEDLRDAGFAGARAATRIYSLPYPRQPNQAWLFWKRFRALADSIKASPPGQADYILFMDVMGSTHDDGTLRSVGAVHVFGTTGAGDLAYGKLRNSMHPIFKRIQPRTMADACRMAVEDLLASREAVLGR